RPPGNSTALTNTRARFTGRPLSDALTVPVMRPAGGGTSVGCAGVSRAGRCEPLLVDGCGDPICPGCCAVAAMPSAARSAKTESARVIVTPLDLKLSVAVDGS